MDKDKNEFKKLKRVNLIEIIYQLQRNEKMLKEQNAQLQQTIEELRELVMRERPVQENAAQERAPLSENTALPAENALEFHFIYDKAQQITDDYIADIERLREQSERDFQKVKEVSKKLITAACDVSKAIMARANKEAKAVIAEAEKKARKTGQPLRKNHPPED